MKIVRRMMAVVGWILLCSIMLAAQKPDLAPLNLLDHFTGRWVLQGVIAGKSTTHDIQADWVLKREYVQMHEISHEQNASGVALYEAIVYLSWDEKAQQYSCLWLDSTAGGGLSAEGIAHAVRAGNSIPLIFAPSDADQIHTTFTYDEGKDSWHWLIENVENGKPRPFADVTLTRAK